ncbi:MAG: hypothetical protein WAN36_13590 [Calditrichia bacterium]
MFKKILDGLKQISNDSGLTNPAVLIPQEVINREIKKKTDGMKEVEALSLTCKKGSGTLTAAVHRTIRFTVEMDLVPQQLRFSENKIIIVLQRILPLRFHAEKRKDRLILRGGNYVMGKLGIDPLIKVAEKIPELSVTENEVQLTLFLNDLTGSPALQKIIKMAESAFKPSRLEFVENGAKIYFQVLPSILGEK